MEENTQAEQNQLVSAKEKKKMKRSTKTILIVAIVILFLVLAVLLTVLIWGKILLGKINRMELDVTPLPSEQIESIRNETDAVDPNYTGPVLDSQDVDMPEDPADKLAKNENIIQILLVGQDRREGQYRQRSDAMILCTINKKTKTLTMTSFLRDLWVRIPGYYDERLNVPYAIAGFPLLNKTLEYQFGIHADHIVEVDFSGFESVVNKIGGVSISLTSAEATQINLSNKGSVCSAGVNLLNGAEALSYARIRAIDSDFYRTNRQRTVLNAVIEKVKTMSATQLYDLALEVLPLVTTDMTDGEITDYVFELATILKDLKVVSQRVPLDGTYESVMIDGKSVLLLRPANLEKNKDFIKKTIGQ